MNQEPKIEFDIALNIMGLTPHNLTYWQEHSGEIRADLANHYGIHAHIFVGAYVADPNIGYRPFLLFALFLDLDTEEGLKQYHEVEAKIQETIKRHIKQ